MPPGNGKSGEEPFPDRRMLRLLIERGVPLTFSSDCHRPDEVGFGAGRVLALLQELGVETRDAPPISLQRGRTRERLGEVRVFRTKK
jgi:hypothetical protein